MKNTARIFVSLILVLLVRISFAQTCTANFTFFLNANGNVQFLSTSTGVDPSTNYSWSFGSGAPTAFVSGQNLTQPAMTYTANGVKTITLSIFTPSTSCTNQIVKTVTISAVTPSCMLNANFSYTTTPVGNILFSSASTGSTGSTTFSWKFGDGGTAFTNTTSHYYNSSGTYTVSLTAIHSTSAVCNDSIERVINVINNCTLSLGSTPNTSTAACNGSAFVSTTTPWACGSAVSYTWSNGSNGPNILSACAGNYSLAMSFAGSGTNCCNVATGTVAIGTCTLYANYNYSQGFNGVVNFSSTSTGTTTGTIYNWVFGDGTNGTGNNPVHTYTANGTYITTLTAVNGSFCASTYTAILNVTTVCPLNASFNAIPGQGGFTSLSSTSTGTSSNTTYTWSFGDQTFQGPCVCPNVTHTYSNNGTYTIALAISNGTCQSISTQTFLVDSLCTLVPGMSYTLGPNWGVNLKSTFAGTTSSTTYLWKFGDNTIGTGSSTFHTYPANGTYTVKLFATNSFTPLFCTDSIIQVIMVNSNCSLTSVINHTVGSSGNVLFSSASTGTNPITSYLWKFGDGTSGTGKNVSHSYSNGGAHLVSLVIRDTIHSSCRDSISQSINITGISCTANPNFTLVPTNVPKFWNAVPAYPWNVMSASWSWGDGSTSSQLYASHIYSVSGTYTICLTVTVSCGASAASCSSYFVFKSPSGASMDMISVNVVAPSIKPVAIIEEDLSGNEFKIYPNPNNGTFIFVASANTSYDGVLEVIDFTGKLILTSKYFGNSETTINTGDLPNGIYFVKIKGSLPQKIIISR